MADGHTVKKLAEKMGRDALGGIGHKGDDSFGFATSTPINRGASKEDIKYGHMEFAVEEPHCNSVDEVLGAADANGGLPRVEGIDKWIPLVVGVPMQQRIGYIEVELEKIRVDIGQLKSRMIDLINTQNGMLDHQAVI